MNELIKKIKTLLPEKLKYLIKDKLRSMIVSILQNRYNIMHRAQLEAENKFFQIDPSIIEGILDGTHINVFDIGARGGIEKTLDKYSHLIKATLVEPDPEEAQVLVNKGYNVIPCLIGDQEGTAILNIGEHGGTSSILKPNGKFLEFYTSGNMKRFNVIDRIELPMTTLDCILEKQKATIDYLKLDTQGTELQIIKGMGKHRPLIIKSEISFVPLYENSTIFFHLGQYLYDIGYILFHCTNYARSSPSKHISRNPYDETLIPTHGDAWFCPDWSREEGQEIINGRERVYKSLMYIFGMKEIHKYAVQKK